MYSFLFMSGKSNGLLPCKDTKYCVAPKNPIFQLQVFFQRFFRKLCVKMYFLYAFISAQNPEKHNHQNVAQKMLLAPVNSVVLYVFDCFLYRHFFTRRNLAFFRLKNTRLLTRILLYSGYNAESLVSAC